MFDPIVPLPVDRSYDTLLGIDLRRFRLGRWLIARRLRLRCLVCNRRAGYGGMCPNDDHNG